MKRWDRGYRPANFDPSVTTNQRPLFKSRGKSAERSKTIHPNQIRVNGRIRVPEVRVILSSTNEQLGIMKTHEAIRKAQSLGLDLVEVAPQARPPVCRIVDFGKFRYNLAKQEKERKTSTSKLKEVKFRVNIDQHDYITKLRRAESFLDKGNKVRVILQFRGREMSHKELGIDLVQRVRTDLGTMANAEAEPKLMGRNVTMTLAPLPANKRKRRFAPIDDLEEEEDDSNDHDHEDGEDSPN